MIIGARLELKHQNSTVSMAIVSSMARFSPLVKNFEVCSLRRNFPLSSRPDAFSHLVDDSRILPKFAFSRGDPSES